MKIDACRNGGKKYAQVQKDKRRSKNEIAFADLCRSAFSRVGFNEPLFDGWDADVVIHDVKVAVLWNGKWHYEQIGKHSLSQVQTRDSIKIQRILDAGFTPYVIKDLGKFDPKFVEQQFNEFMKQLRVGEGGIPPDS